MDQIVYQRHGAPEGRTIVVGDIHGCYEEMLELLRLLKFSDRDLLISVGDLVDRGPGSLDVVRYFMEHDNALAVAGNHERKIRRILEDGLAPGPMQTLLLNQIPPEELETVHAYLRSMPVIIETPHVLVVHARLDPAKPLSEQNLKYCAAVGGPSVEFPVDEEGVPLWYWEWRQGAEQPAPIVPGRPDPARVDGGAIPAGSDAAGASEPTQNGRRVTPPAGPDPHKPICFGHRQFDRVELVPRRLYALDTSAVAAGRLTAYVVEENRIVDLKVPRDYFAEARAAWKAHVVANTDVRTQTIRSVDRIGEPDVVDRQRRAFEEAGVFERAQEIHRKIERQFGPMPPAGPERGQYVQTVRSLFRDVPPRLGNLLTREKPVSWEDVRRELPRESLVSLMENLDRMDAALGDRAGTP